MRFKIYITAAEILQMQNNLNDEEKKTQPHTKTRKKKTAIDASSKAEQLLRKIDIKAKERQDISVGQTKMISSPPVINFESTPMDSREVLTKQCPTKKQTKQPIITTEKLKAKRKISENKQKSKFAFTRPNIQQPIQTNG